MLSRGLNFGLRFSPRRVVTQATANNATSTIPDSASERDPAPYFFNKEVQNLLRTVTRPVYDVVFRRRLDGEKLAAPVYKFMTNEQLEKARYRAEKEMLSLLQMPPVVKVRVEDGRILAKDPALQGYSSGKFVFTDITFGVSNKDRIIAVRETDGTLRKALHAEKDRINQIYFPIPGREVYMPKMFQDEHLKSILDRGDCDFVLNRACIQFDPDSEDFHRVTKITYDHVDDEMQYDKLRSTRHYGPMVFYLAWNKKIDNLLLENITTGRLEDAALVIRLYYILNPSEKAIKEEDHIKLIQHYTATEAGNKRKLEHALRMQIELEAEKRKIAENIEMAHGKTKNSDEEIKT